MGGYWSTEEEWEVSALRALKRFEEKISEVRPTCKSHTNDKVAKGECCQTKKSCRNPGGKPTNVATFAKKKKKQGVWGGRREE